MLYEVITKLAVIQLHGDEDEFYINSLKKLIGNIQIWKAVRVQTSDDISKAEKLPVDMLLIDSFSKNSYNFV